MGGQTIVECESGTMIRKSGDSIQQTGDTP